jgi:demethoxyubiquinone hydroxylase (CLK1/Coq7/Cat5 family)
VSPTAPDAAARASLVRLLQMAHAGELAAAHAYRGHWRSLEDPVQRAEVRRIETAEWHHRHVVAGLLSDLGARPARRRELLMLAIGRTFGPLCHVAGWFLPMYFAGRLEAMNVGQYATAAEHATAAGLDHLVPVLAEMTAEEARHEAWFGDRVRGHRLLPVARVLGRWSPAIAGDQSSPSQPGARSTR